MYRPWLGEDAYECALEEEGMAFEEWGDDEELEEIFELFGEDEFFFDGMFGE